MINYEKARKAIRRTYVIRNGYNDDFEVCGLAFQDGLAVEVWERGCHRANGRTYANEEEMIYYFDSHKAVHFPQAERGFALLHIKSFTSEDGIYFNNQITKQSKRDINK